MPLPKLPSLHLGAIDVTATVKEFLAALHSINHHLETLVDLQQQANSADRLARATDRRQAAERTATDIGQALPTSLFHDHETDDTGRVTWCPTYALTGQRRVHQVRADGLTVSCHPEPDEDRR